MDITWFVHNCLINKRCRSQFYTSTNNRGDNNLFKLMFILYAYRETHPSKATLLGKEKIRILTLEIHRNKSFIHFLLLLLLYVFAKVDGLSGLKVTLIITNM